MASSTIQITADSDQLIQHRDLFLRILVRNIYGQDMESPTVIVKIFREEADRLEDMIGKEPS
jgi:hypothetical protein